MILYHASTMYHLLCCIVHRLAYHADEHADLLLLEYIKPLNKQKEFYDRLCKFGFFSSVRYVPEQKIKLKKGIALDESSSTKDIEKVIDNISSAFEKWFDDDIKKYRKIYVASDQHSCGIFLIKNKINYNYMEDASGMLSEEGRYLSITKSNNLTNHIISNYLGCAGRNEFVTEKLCDLKNQAPGFHDEKAVDFSIYDTLKNVIPNKVPVLLDFFGGKHEVIKSNRKICLFLTQDLNTLKVKDPDLQELISTLLVDYICPDCKLVIKPHPKDRWQNYSRIFPDAVLLKREFPSELLPFTVEGNIDVALTASSTSVRGVSSFCNHAYYFTTEIETNHETIDDMYVLTEILKKLGIYQSVNFSNINIQQIRCFLNNAGIVCNGNDYLIDGGNKYEYSQNFKRGKINFCLNSGQVINFNPRVKNNNFIIITAKFIPLKKSLVSEKNTEIYAYGSDIHKLEKLADLKFERNLKYSKADVKVTCRKADKNDFQRLEAKLRRDLIWEEKENE